MQLYGVELAYYSDSPSGYQWQSGPFVDPVAYLGTGLEIDMSETHRGLMYSPPDSDEQRQRGQFLSIDEMHLLQDLFPVEANQIQGLYHKETQQLMGYLFEAARIEYTCQYPRYAQIDAERPEHIHYFHKFPDVDFPLATETLKRRIRELEIPGFIFTPKWDGQQVVGLPPAE